MLLNDSLGFSFCHFFFSLNFHWFIYFSTCLMMLTWLDYPSVVMVLVGCYFCSHSLFQ